MQLGKKLGTGFVSDDAQATVDEEAVRPAGGADAPAPGASPRPAPVPEPEPTAAS
jgi:hypothetical protein